MTLDYGALEDGNNNDDDKDPNGDDGKDARITETSFLTQQSTSGLEGMPQSSRAKFLKPCNIDYGLDPLSPA